MDRIKVAGLAALLVASAGVSAQQAVFDATSSTLTIPAIRVGAAIYSNVKLKPTASGSFAVIDAVVGSTEAAITNELSLTTGIMTLPKLRVDVGSSPAFYKNVTFRNKPNTLEFDLTGGEPDSGTSTLAIEGVTVSESKTQTAGAFKFGSSSRLQVSWKAPTGTAPSRYEVTARDAAGRLAASAQAAGTATAVTLSDLKASTAYTVTVTVCGDGACTASRSATASGTTPAEFWQLQGTGSTTAGLTRIVSDGNARISATRIGPDAGGATASRIQLYYGPSGLQQPAPLSTAITSTATSTASPTSYLSFTSSRGTTGLGSPSSATSLIAEVATGQGVPLSAALGGRTRLFFEAKGSDKKTRIFWIDSVDGYVGQDFNAGAATLCATAADYSAGGGCPFTVAIGVEGDAQRPTQRLNNVRQHKVGYPTLTDWRWDGAAGTFMVFTFDQTAGCAAGFANHGYAVWDGSAWKVQTASNGCPKAFESAQAAFPLHIGGVRYKMYYGDPSVTTGRLTSGLPFLGPKKLVYADGALTGSAAVVDFEDWEALSSARDVIFLWPSGDKLDDTAEGYIDDFHFLTPTGSLELQVMYLAITNGTEMPFAAAAVLLNP